jgi:3-methyladenine DNA glycosylase AlkD
MNVVETTNKILKELESLAQIDYKIFNDKIINTEQKTLGVRVSALRKIAKRLAKEMERDEGGESDAVRFINSDKQNIYELVMIEGMILSYINKPFEELLPLTEKFLTRVDNWAQVDSTVCDFKNIRNEKEDVLRIVKKWLKSDKEFIVRTGLVILLAHFVQRENLKMIFELSQSVKHTGYYVYMANAWLVSVCMAKFPKETIKFFKKNKLDNKTHNKAIQKSRESFRVSKNDKELVNKLKR